MSFVRPELRARAARLFTARFVHWVEPLVVLGLFALALFLGLGFLRGGGWVGGAVGAVALATGVVTLIAFGRRAKFERGGTAQGLVEIDERRVAYLAPQGGGIVALGGVARIEIHAAEGDPKGLRTVWVLTDARGQSLVIPAGARGAGALADALAGLPGIRLDRAAAALAGERAGRHLIWSAPGDGTFPNGVLEPPGRAT
ncbi:MAG: hypothetical protein AAF281_12265 [Pseudomonadota bacterium]